jgi:hypothetical protein
MDLSFSETSTDGSRFGDTDGAFGTSFGGSLENRRFYNKYKQKTWHTSALVKKYIRRSPRGESDNSNIWSKDGYKCRPRYHQKS